MKEDIGFKKTVIGMAVAMTALGAVAMPTKAQFQQTMPLVKEVSAEDSAAVKAGTLKPKEAGDRALERASDSSLDEAARYLFFEMAFSYYVSAAEYDKAAEVVGKLKSDIKDVPDSAIVELIERRLRKVKREQAGQLYEILQSARTREQMSAKVSTYQKAVKANPSDTISQARLGYCNVLIGNWDAALKAFAKADGEVAKMAKAELYGKGKSAAELGDFWWKFAINDYNFRSYAEQLAEGFKAHAVEHYKKALKSPEMKGLKRQVIVQRVGEDVAVQGGSLPVKVFDIGKGVKMEFIECPKGTFMMGAEPTLWNDDRVLRGDEKRDNSNPMYPHKVTITRPFLMSKYPVTIADWNAVVGENEYKEIQSVFGERSCVVLGIDKELRFVNTLATKLGPKLPKGCVVRMPTEAEFEYAFRSGANGGDDLYAQMFKRAVGTEEMAGVVYTPAKELVAVMVKNGYSDAGKRIAESRHSDYYSMMPYVELGKPGLIGVLGPVGKYKPNAWGFFDMFMGSVCLDRFGLVDNNKEEAKRSGFANGEAKRKGLRYRDEDVDPVLNYIPQGSKQIRGLSYRPYKDRFKDVQGTCTMHVMRIVIGPDLRKEKGLEK